MAVRGKYPDERQAGVTGPAGLRDLGRPAPARTEAASARAAAAPGSGGGEGYPWPPGSCPHTVVATQTLGAVMAARVLSRLGIRRALPGMLVVAVSLTLSGQAAQAAAARPPPARAITT